MESGLYEKKERGKVRRSVGEHEGRRGEKGREKGNE